MARLSSRSALRAFASTGALLVLAACDREPMGPSLGADAGRNQDVSALAAPDPRVFTGTIRIGVVQSASSVALGSEGDWTIRDRVTDAVVMTGTGGSAAVTLASVVSSWFRLQVMCGNPTAVATRKAAAEAAGVPTFTEFVASANCTRLFLGRYPTNASFSVRSAYRSSLITQGLAGTDSFWAIKADPGVTLYRVTRGTQTVDVPNPVYITAANGIVTIAGAKYRREGEVRMNSAGTLAGINQLPMEEYLYGVVPRELGPVAYPEMEAQKAQAVAARTWALLGFTKRLADGYNLRATTDDQVYGGYSAEHPISNQAVDETAGIVATYNGKPISTFYSSTTGGHTASYEEWLDGAAPIPYLTGVPDAQRGRALEHVPSLDVFKNHANPASLRNAKEGDWESNWARYHRWEFEWTNEEISRVISAFAGRDVGKVLEINVLERGPSGRVLKIQYVTETDTLISTRNGIRSSLKFIDAKGVMNNFLSTLFFIEPVIDRRTKELAGFKAYGGGFGHGVGMSQTGAVGMAEKGRTYDEILKHYYQGIELEKQY